MNIGTEFTLSWDSKTAKQKIVGLSTITFGLLIFLSSHAIAAGNHDDTAKSVTMPNLSTPTQSRILNENKSTLLYGHILHWLNRMEN